MLRGRLRGDGGGRRDSGCSRRGRGITCCGGEHATRVRLSAQSQLEIKSAWYRWQDRATKQRQADGETKACLQWLQPDDLANKEAFDTRGSADEEEMAARVARQWAQHMGSARGCARAAAVDHRCKYQPMRLTATHQNESKKIK